MVARYDKIHLFDVLVEGDSKRVYQESAGVEPGNELVVADTPFGRIGLSVCYDLRFPEMFRGLAASEMDLLMVPSAFTAVTGKVHWEVLLRARAIENLCYVVAPAQAGRHEGGRETYGDSLIVDPWGEVLARLPTGNGVVVHEINRQRLTMLRSDFPALQHSTLEVGLS
jgi:nitrilase